MRAEFAQVLDKSITSCLLVINREEGSFVESEICLTFVQRSQQHGSRREPLLPIHDGRTIAG